MSTGSDMSGHQKQVSRSGRLLVWLFLFGTALYFLAPVYWLVVASTKSPSALFSTPGFLFGEINVGDNLASLSSYQGGIFWRWLLNSAIYSGLGAFLMTALSLVSGYALTVYRFKGRAFILSMVAGSMLVPQTVLAQPTYSLVVLLGLNNTYWGVLLPSLVYPFGVLLGFVYAQASITKEVVEAARLDGASEWRIFRSIALRLLVPGGVTIALFAFIGTWNNYMLPLLVLNKSELLPVTVGLANWNAASTTVPILPSLIVVGSLVSVVPIVLVFTFLRRYWKQGFDLSGTRF